MRKWLLAYEEGIRDTREYGDGGIYEE